MEPKLCEMCTSLFFRAQCSHPKPCAECPRYCSRCQSRWPHLREPLSRQPKKRRTLVEEWSELVERAEQAQKAQKAATPIQVTDSAGAASDA